MNIFVGLKCKTQMGLGSQEYSRGGLATVYSKTKLKIRILKTILTSSVKKQLYKARERIT